MILLIHEPATSEQLEQMGTAFDIVRSLMGE